MFMYNIFTIRITKRTLEESQAILLQYSEDEYKSIPKALREGLESLGYVWLNGKKIINYSLK